MEFGVEFYSTTKTVSELLSFRTTKMKQGCCRMSLLTLSQTLLVMDLFRAMLTVPILIGTFCGLSTVDVHRLKEHIWDGTTIVVDYYKIRALMTGGLIIGMIICGTDVMLALSFDHITTTKTSKKVYRTWLVFATAGLVLRTGFYSATWKFQNSLGLQRMHEFTPGIHITLQVLFVIGIAYEMVKVIELIVAAALQFNSVDYQEPVIKKSKLGKFGTRRR